VTIAAREIEFLALSMSSTQQGYKMRIAKTVDAVQVLPDLLRDNGHGGDEDSEAFEDAQVILDSVKRAYKGLDKKGKGRAM
jgi:hypothetical protein